MSPEERCRLVQALVTAAFGNESHDIVGGSDATQAWADITIAQAAANAPRPKRERACRRNLEAAMSFESMLERIKEHERYTLTPEGQEAAARDQTAWDAWKREVIRKREAKRTKEEAEYEAKHTLWNAKLCPICGGDCPARDVCSTDDEMRACLQWEGWSFRWAAEHDEKEDYPSDVFVCFDSRDEEMPFGLYFGIGVRLSLIADGSIPCGRLSFYVPDAVYTYSLPRLSSLEEARTFCESKLASVAAVCAALADLGTDMTLNEKEDL